jgi:hypothetical protein
MKTFFQLFIFVGLISCEMVSDVNVPAEEPKITLNATFVPDSVFNVKLSSSQYILSMAPIQPISKAKVFVFENGNLYDTLTERTPGKYISLRNRKSEKGKSYKIQVQAEGFETVESQSYIPEEVQLKDVKYIQRQGYSEMYGSYNSVIEATIVDPGTEKDNYEFKLFVEQHWTNHQTQETMVSVRSVGIFIDDPALGESQNVIFNDSYFNGKEIKIHIKVYSSFSSTKTKFLLRARKLSNELYKYKITSELQSEGDGDPFAQPVTVFNNVTNGFGIFGGYSQVEVELQP